MQTAGQEAGGASKRSAPMEREGDEGGDPKEEEGLKEFDLPAHLSFDGLIDAIVTFLEKSAVNGVKEIRGDAKAALKCAIRYEESGKTKKAVVKVRAGITENRRMNVSVSQRRPITAGVVATAAVAWVVNPLLGGAIAAKALRKSEDIPMFKEALFQEIDRFLCA